MKIQIHKHSGEEEKAKSSSDHIIIDENNTKNKVNEEHDNQNALSLWQLFSRSWQCQLAVFFNYVVTLSLFPGVLSLMAWDNSNDEWFAVIQIFLFNLFDTVKFITFSLIFF